MVIDVGRVSKKHVFAVVQFHSFPAHENEVVRCDLLNTSVDVEFALHEAAVVIVMKMGAMMMMMVIVIFLALDVGDTHLRSEVGTV